MRVVLFEAICPEVVPPHLDKARVQFDVGIIDNCERVVEDKSRGKRR